MMRAFYLFLLSIAWAVSLGAQVTLLPLLLSDTTGKIWAVPQNGPFPYDVTTNPLNPVVTGLQSAYGLTLFNQTELRST